METKSLTGFIYDALGIGTVLRLADGLNFERCIIWFEMITDLTDFGGKPQYWRETFEMLVNIKEKVKFSGKRYF